MASIHNRKLIAALAKQLKAKDSQTEEPKEAYLYSIVSLQVWLSLIAFDLFIRSITTKKQKQVDEELYYLYTAVFRQSLKSKFIPEVLIIRWGLIWNDSKDAFSGIFINVYEDIWMAPPEFSIAIHI